MDPDTAELRQMIEEARRVVIFTGAGISTEFGHPGFSQPWRDMDEDATDRLF